MKTIYNYLILISIVFLTAGCVQESFVEPEADVEIAAWMEYEADTRTTLSDFDGQMYYPIWSEGDEIAVFADGESSPSRFTLKTGEGTTSATFSGSMTGGDLTAIYPFDMAATKSDGTVSLVLPQLQKYVKDSFGMGAYPMYATGTVQDGLNFRNLCAVLKITFSGSAAIRSVTLTSRDKKCFLSGSASVKTDPTESSDELLTMSAGGSNSVTLDCKGLVVSKYDPVDVYIVVPAQTYTRGFTIDVDTYTQKVTKNITTSLKFERSQMRAITDFKLNSEIPTLIPESIPNNEIWYVSSDNTKLEMLGDTSFGANVISHKYSNGYGVIRFDADVTKIIGEVFEYQDAQKLNKVVLPGSIEYVERSPFYSSQNLNEIMGPLASSDGKCLVIGGSQLGAFAQQGMAEYTTPSGLTSIAPLAFHNNSVLKKIVISEGVSSIGFKAFMNMPALQEVTLPSSLTALEEEVFAQLPSLKKFHGGCGFVSNDNLSLIVDNYCNSGIKTLVAYASASFGSEYSIPEGVQDLAPWAFYHAKNLTKLNFPDSFEAFFSNNPFEGASNIRSITGKYVAADGRSLVKDGCLKYVAPGGLRSYTTSEGVIKLGFNALNYMKDLTELVLSDEIQGLESHCHMFYGNPKLEKITISAAMNDLGANPFVALSDFTPSLKTVYCRAVIPPYMECYLDADAYDFSDLTIYVPKESYKQYMASSVWQRYVDYIEPYDYGDLGSFSPDYYVSTDYSSDGTVKNLQRATRGNGINIVLMGDAYSDRAISDGTYDADMRFLYQNLFTEEPFKTYKKMFNVYYVNVVSMTDGYENPGSALGGYFGEGTLVGGNDQKCFDYALKAISEEAMDDALIIVAMNSNVYAGTCWMYTPISNGDYGSGASIAYFPKGEDTEVFAQLLHHEANGHGFAKLADEYAYEDYGPVPSDVVNETKQFQNVHGWYKNIDFTSNKRTVRWANFLDDSRYANEGLGCFEGGFTYWTGVWRPTEDSIMNTNVGGFNAPCREAIYYRINKLANGDSWEYDYEDFVRYDAINRASALSAGSLSSNYVERVFEPTAPPVVMKKSWRDAE